MRKSTIEKLGLEPGVNYRIIQPTQRSLGGHHWTQLLVGNQIALIQEYKNEADGFDVWTPSPGNSIASAKQALGLSE